MDTKKAHSMQKRHTRTRTTAAPSRMPAPQGGIQVVRQDISAPMKRRKGKV